MVNAGVIDESNKVFYKTSGLQLKNSLSNQRQMSLSQYNRRTTSRLPRGNMPDNTLREFTGKLKPENLKETVLTKKPTMADLKESLIKYGNKLNTFYQREDIKKITED